MLNVKDLTDDELRILNGLLGAMYHDEYDCGLFDSTHKERKLRGLETLDLYNTGSDEHLSLKVKS